MSHIENKSIRPSALQDSSGSQLTHPSIALDSIFDMKKTISVLTAAVSLSASLLLLGCSSEESALEKMRKSIEENSKEIAERLGIDTGNPCWSAELDLRGSRSTGGDRISAATVWLPSDIEQPSQGLVCFFSASFIDQESLGEYSRRGVWCSRDNRTNWLSPGSFTPIDQFEADRCLAGLR